MTKMNRIAARKRAFTLVELMVVVLIIAILAAMIVPKLVSRTSDAKISKAQADIRTLSSQIDAFRIDVGRYPTTEEGLQVLRIPPADAVNWKGPYVNKDIPMDPWNNPYEYEYPGAYGENSFIIRSYGSDAAPGGEGEAADITGDDV